MPRLGKALKPWLGRRRLGFGSAAAAAAAASRALWDLLALTPAAQRQPPAPGTAQPGRSVPRAVPVQ